MLRSPLIAKEPIKSSFASAGPVGTMTDRPADSRASGASSTRAPSHVAAIRAGPPGRNSAQPTGGSKQPRVLIPPVLRDPLF